jgi:hypothetical protein
MLPPGSQWEMEKRPILGGPLDQWPEAERHSSPHLHDFLEKEVECLDFQNQHERQLFHGPHTPVCTLLRQLTFSDDCMDDIK